MANKNPVNVYPDPDGTCDATTPAGEPRIQRVTSSAAPENESSAAPPASQAGSDQPSNV